MIDSEVNYKYLFDIMRDACIRVDMEGNLLLVNDMYCAMLGYEREDLLSKSYIELTPEKWHAFEFDIIQNQVITKGVSKVYTKEYQRKDGTIFPVELLTTLIRDENGNPSGMWATVRDISDRMQMHQELRRAHNEYLTLAENSPDILIRFDRNYTHTYVNPAAAGNVNLTKEQLIGKSLSQIGIPEALANSWQRRLATVFETGKSITIEETMPSPDGVRYFEYHTVPEYLQDRTISSILVIGRDITARKKMEQMLRESENRLRTIYEYSPIAIGIGEIYSGRLIEVNDAWLQLFGYSREEVIGHTTYDLNLYIKSEERNEIAKIITNQGRVIHHHVQLRHKTGEIIDVLYSADKITLESNDFLQVVISDITEQKLVEESLINSQDKLLKTFKASPDAISIVSMKDGRYVEVNDNFLRISGFSRDEVIGHTAIDLDVWADVNARQSYLDTLAQLGFLKRVEVEFRMKNKQIRFFEVSSEIISISGEQFSLNFNSDITERRQAEAALRKSEFFFKESQRAAFIGSYFTDFITGKWESSEVLDTIFGIDKDYDRNIEGWLNIVHPDDRDNMNKHLSDEVILNRNPFSKEYRIVRNNDGITRWVKGLGTAEFDSNGHIQSLIGTIQDITESKHKEIELAVKGQALANSERFLKTIIDSEPECIKMLDADCKLLMMNLAGLKMIEANSFEEVKGQCICPIVTDKYTDAFVALTKNIFAGISGTLEFEIIGLKGRHRWLETHAVPFRDERGDIVALLGITRDITDQRMLEIEKKSLEQQVIFAQKMESLGVLAGGIAHDFNNILAIIIGHCYLAKTNYEKACNHISVIDKAANRAAELCRQMLAYAGKSNTAQNQIDIGNLVNEMVKMLRTTLPQNADVSFSNSDDIPLISCDASQIRQVVMNLIINASEAIGDGHGNILVSLTKICIKHDQPLKDHLGKKIEPNWYACLEVSDDGCGMDKETKQRIFEPFYTTKFTGRGLGMSAVLGIILAHGGALQFSSKQGHGSNFKIYLPIQIGNYNGKDSTQQVDLVQWRGSGTVLLVDDEEQLRYIAKEMLTTLGFTVLEASNGGDALDLYQSNSAEIILVITDVGMPIMNGYELSRKLKIISQELPIIISSGFGDSDIVSKISTNDIARIIGKPYSFGKLQEVIKYVLKQH